MAYVLTDAFAFVGGYDFTGDSNECTVEVESEALVHNPFGTSWEQNIAGVTSVDWNLAGFWNVTDAEQDDEEWGQLGTADRVVTFGPGTNTEGDPAYMFRSLTTRYEAGGSHGELAGFNVSAQGSNGQGVVRGRLLAAKQTVSSTGAFGTGVQLGAVGASEYLYATFHVFSAGTTITVVVESDDNASFTSATTRATFSTITAAGGTWATRVAGAITDDYWRVRCTAVTGSFSVAAAVGIQ